jgi:hypothetical protein
MNGTLVKEPHSGEEYGSSPAPGLMVCGLYRRNSDDFRDSPASGSERLIRTSKMIREVNPTFELMTLIKSKNAFAFFSCFEPEGSQHQQTP